MKNRKKQDNATAQSAIYVGFVDTPGLFASIIRRVIGQNYVHVVLGFDPELKEAYSTVSYTHLTLPTNSRV